MSGLAVFALIAVWVLAGLAACAWIIRPLKQRIAAPTPARIDQQPGINLALADECELIWAAPYNPQVGLDRLRDEIQKQREEDGQ